MPGGRSAGPLVLCYHALSARWPADLSVTPDAFGNQMELLAARGYRGVTFAEAIRARPGTRVVAVTFDDAFSSVLRHARPVLDALGFAGSVYVVTGSTGDDRPTAWAGTDRWLGGPFEAELEALGWDELRQLADAGWEIGSHTATHPHLTELDDEALERELATSRAVVEDRLGRPCPTLAYPYGDVNDRVVAAARRAGYDAAGALPSGLSGDDPLRWPRIGIYHGDSGARYRLKVAPSVVRLRSSAAWDAVRAARRLRPRPARQAG
jgi:peptidoglycan/xylan/chitin deacetylase (PgdA/CDA1 family)